MRVYDDWDGRERINQMEEWSEGEEDRDSYEIPKLESDLPACLHRREFDENGRPLAAFPLPRISELRRVDALKLYEHPIVCLS